MKTLFITIKFLLLITFITGILYPLFIFSIARIFFPEKSEGSFVEKNGIIVGSKLIAQKFESPAYFHPRPSFVNYQPLPSGASNYGPLNLKLKTISDSLKKEYIRKNFLPENISVPMDALFFSGSGVDPHISPENAILQIERISLSRGFDSKKKKELENLVKNLTENPQFGFLGEPRINVLILNIELDKL